ncbi:MAG: ABC transporter ATP-binding protein [Candidatus Heimdallarchaeaceae archaeon]
MSEFMVETFNLSKSFQTTLAVNNVNLKIPKGSIYALLGPNGAGKTTTIRLLLGLLKPTKGKVIVNDIDVSLHSKKIRGQISLLPQFSAAYYDLTPLKNIKFIIELNGIRYEDVLPDLEDFFHKLEITSELLNKPFSKLSGGEQRAISFIMAAITNREFLILDEPTSGLDIARAKYIRSIIRDLADKGKTVLLSSHIVSDLEELAEYCGVLKKGKLVFQGKKEEIISHFAPSSGSFEDAIIEAFKTPEKEIIHPLEGF